MLFFVLILILIIYFLLRDRFNLIQEKIYGFWTISESIAEILNVDEMILYICDRKNSKNLGYLYIKNEAGVINEPVEIKFYPNVLDVIYGKKINGRMEITGQTVNKKTNFTIDCVNNIMAMYDNSTLVAVLIRDNETSMVVPQTACSKTGADVYSKSRSKSAGRNSTEGYSNLERPSVNMDTSGERGWYLDNDGDSINID